jgi:hypothetical protein
VPPPDDAPPQEQAAPNPTAIAPTKCPAAGGTKVTITGTGFTGATSVTFGAPSGAKLPAQFVVDSDTQITATTPDSTRDYTSSSDLSVVITTPAGSNPIASAPWVTFGDRPPVPPATPDRGPPPKPTAIAPTKCPAGGGTKVTITGTGFTGATSVTFGAPSGAKLPAQFVVDSDTQITATTPDSTRDYTSSSDLSVVITTPAGSNPIASAPWVTFGDRPPAAPNRGR